MTPLSEQVLRAMMHIRTDVKSEPFLKWMRDSLVEDSVKNNGQRDEVECRMMQGRNQRLQEIINIIDGSQSQLDAIKNNQLKDRAAGAAY